MIEATPLTSLRYPPLSTQLGQDYTKQVREMNERLAGGSEADKAEDRCLSTLYDGRPNMRGRVNHWA